MGGLGVPLGSLGTYWDSLVIVLGSFEIILKSFWDRFDIILGSFGDRFGIIWESCGSYFSSTRLAFGVLTVRIEIVWCNRGSVVPRTPSLVPPMVRTGFPK